ncbi:MAG: dipeptidase PepV [Thermosediminibacteraceae bacterium]|nr:dipeptidase PepV [Thermosediminibacteraceae bacterium]
MEDILNAKIDEYFDEMVKDLQEFIKIPSVLDETNACEGYPFGIKIGEALKWILKKGDNLGLKTKNLDGYAGYIEIGSGQEMVGILSHIDVVPPGAGWSVDPFGGEIKDGKIYGRGSIDDKGPALAVLYALKAIKESNLPVTKRARLIIGTDEETGARCIRYYLEKEEMPVYGFSPDAEFPIIHAEKGILRFTLVKDFDARSRSGVNLKRVRGGTRVNIVPDEAEALIEGITLEKLAEKIEERLKEKLKVEETPEGIVIKAKGISAHASYPEDGENAIQILFNFLSQIDFGGREAKEFINSLVAKLNMEVDGRTLGVSCSDEISGTLTINLGVADFDENRGVLKFDIRYPVTVDGNEIIEKLKKAFEDLGVEFLVDQHKLPLYVEADKDFIRKLQHVYKEMTGEEPRLLSIGGGTYCRYVKNTVSFGPVFPGQKELAHQKDEYISLDDFRRIAKIYVQAIYELIK